MPCGSSGERQVAKCVLQIVDRDGEVIGESLHPVTCPPARDDRWERSAPTDEDGLPSGLCRTDLQQIATFEAQHEPRRPAVVAVADAIQILSQEGAEGCIATEYVKARVRIGPGVIGTWERSVDVEKVARRQLQLA